MAAGVELKEYFVCPVTRTALEVGRGLLGQFELHNSSVENPLAFPISHGIPVLLPQQARSLNVKKSQE